ncbi:hypothetical protein LINPERPRIM_LOCUS39088 [Linum perenne]
MCIGQSWRCTFRLMGMTNFGTRIIPTTIL